MADCRNLDGVGAATDRDPAVTAAAQSVSGGRFFPSGDAEGAAGARSVSAVNVGADANIYVSHRCVDDSCAGHDSIDPILIYDTRGHLMRSMGAGLFNWPHGIRAMPDQSVRATDAGVVAATDGGRGVAARPFTSTGPAR